MEESGLWWLYEGWIGWRHGDVEKELILRSLFENSNHVRNSLSLNTQLKQKIGVLCC